MSIIQNGVRGTVNQGVPGIHFKNVGTNGGRCQEPFGLFESLVLGGELSMQEKYPVSHKLLVCMPN